MAAPPSPGLPPGSARIFWRRLIAPFGRQEFPELRLPLISEKRTASAQFELLLRDLYARLDERDKFADHLLKFLLNANGAGIAFTMAFVGGVFGKAELHPTAYFAFLFYAFGLLLVGAAIAIAHFISGKNRHALRDLMSDYVRGRRTYANVFISLGRLHSKSLPFNAACVASSLALSVAVALTLCSLVWSDELLAPTKPPSVIVIVAD